MKTTLRYLSLNAQATWHRQVEEQLKRLHNLTAIRVTERMTDRGPVCLRQVQR